MNERVFIAACFRVEWHAMVVESVAPKTLDRSRWSEMLTAAEKTLLTLLQPGCSIR